MAATWFVLVVLAVSSVWSSSVPRESRPPQIVQLTNPVELAEGPVWDELDQVLYFVDIDGHTLHRFNPDTKKDQVLKFGEKLAFVLPVQGQKYGFVVAQGRNLMLLLWDYDRGFSRFWHILTVDSHSPGNRWNEALVDAKGRIWAGTKGPEDSENNSPPDKATLYRIDTTQPLGLQRTADVMLRPVSISNGMAFSLNHTVFYFIDSPTNTVESFDFNLEEGTIANRRTVFDLRDHNITGIPDGMTIDCDGNIWVSSIGPGLILKVDPGTGNVLQTLQLPVTDVTSVAFGGHDMSTLFVTTKKPVRLEDRLQQPLAGAVFKVTGLGVRGVPGHRVVFNFQPTALTRDSAKTLVTHNQFKFPG